jgi:hypothetical protein
VIPKESLRFLPKINHKINTIDETLNPESQDGGKLPEKSIW